MTDRQTALRDVQTRRSDDGTTRSDSYVRWHLGGVLAEPEYIVVRVTYVVERLAGPFKTVRSAEKWIADQQEADPQLSDGLEATDGR